MSARSRRTSGTKTTRTPSAAWRRTLRAPTGRTSNEATWWELPAPGGRRLSSKDPCAPSVASPTRSPDAARTRSMQARRRRTPDFGSSAVPGSKRVVKHSCGSRRRVRWCWTSSIDSSCGNPAGRRRWAAVRCWILRRRGAPVPPPRSDWPARRGGARRSPGDPRRRARCRSGRRRTRDHRLQRRRSASGRVAAPRRPARRSSREPVGSPRCVPPRTPVGGG